jgi:hypothetical protein
MTRKFALYMICLAVLVGMHFSAVASAEIVVGVKPGDWIEYNVAFTGDIIEQHDVTWARIEVIAVEGKTIDITITSIFSDGREETETLTLNLETGQIGDAFIIPANLDKGDTFLEQYEGTITISGVEEKTYMGANRKVVYATTSQTTFYWDQSTGFLVEATSFYTDFTMVTNAEKTNMWQTQAFKLNPIVFIVLIVLVIVAALALAIFLIRKMKK